MLRKLECSPQIIEINTQISNLVNIRPLAAELLHTDRRTDGRTDRQTDMTDLLNAFAKLRKRLKITH